MIVGADEIQISGDAWRNCWSCSKIRPAYYDVAFFDVQLSTCSTLEGI